VCQFHFVFPTEGNDAKVPQVFTENYETDQTRETFQENFLHCPLGLALFWD